MISRRIWGFIAVLVVTLVVGFFLPKPLMHFCLRSFSFYFLIALILICIRLMIGVYRNDLAGRVRSRIPVILMASTLTALIFILSPPRFKILADETNLLGVSLMMHETRSAVVPLEGVYTGYSAPDVMTTTPKRPMLFSFLLALLHGILGYRPANIFILNFMISIGVFLLFYLFITKLLPKSYGMVGIMLMAATPIYVMCATSGGFELLNMLVLIWVAFLIIDMEINGYENRKITTLMFSMMLLIHCRYESILIPLVVIPFLVAKMQKTRFFHEMPLSTALLPIFLLPVFWQRMIYWGKPEFNRTDIGQYTVVDFPFGWKNIITNVDDNLVVLMGLNPNYGFSPILFGLSILGVYLFLRKTIKREPPKRDKRLFFMASGVFLLLFVFISSFYWGNFGIPMDMRLSLVFLPFLCWSGIYGIYRIQQRFSLKYQKGANVWVVLLAVFHLLLFWPVGAHQRALKEMLLPYEYGRVLDFLETNYPNRENILIVSEFPNLYLVQGYSALKINNPQKVLSTVQQPNIFDRILFLQRYDKESRSILDQSRIAISNFELREVGSMSLTPKIGLRISELRPAVKG